ncbi:HSF-type DNA-binding-domain-containing protein [Schizophyllum amplum]|uniref:Transcription factor n=1 Tax=Schizophyllum amplum TaxID=97359 RepID=A0A550C978_9AGAR|nr:HSF-type DNA-binding-domain-containing protein [Auriculariopsis ampla]
MDRGQQSRQATYQQPTIYHHRPIQPAFNTVPQQQSGLPWSRNDQTVKHEPMSEHNKDGSADDGMPSTSDFVKKLYKMLEDQSFQHVVCWGPHGDCFVVKDMNEFTKSILPRMFKHSNFASFVRQLNKYDFHKVKNTDDNTYGEHDKSWTFRHPDFHADRRDALENIKRKVPAQRKSTAPPAPQPQPSFSGGYGNSPGGAYVLESLQTQVTSMQSQVARMEREKEDMQARMRTLERNYQDVLVELVGFQRGMAQQDGLMQNLLQYVLRNDSSAQLGSMSGLGALGAKLKLPPTPTEGNPFIPSVETQRLFSGAYNQGQQGMGAAGPSNAPSMGGSSASPPDFGQSGDYGSAPRNDFGFAPPAEFAPTPDDVARASLHQMNELSRRATGGGGGGWGDVGGAEQGRTRMQAEMARAAGQMDAQMGQGSPMGSSMGQTSSMGAGPSMNSGAQQKTEDEAEDEVVMPSSGAGPSSAMELVPHEGLQVYTVGHLMPRADDGYDQNQAGPSSGGGASKKLRVRRSTFVPGWAVPPRVLLVDDDAVSRKLSSKFLQIFGCAIDVAVDGVSAVNKMNLEKYDLVLMDIVMPKLDGVSATSLIRKFDHMTPIISMTGNAKPNEIMTYYSSGMNDILPKPFSKEGLLDMLEKHLMHLKVIQQMSRSLPQAVSENADIGFGLGGWEDDGKINPLAGMGLTDEQYNAMLQNIVNGDAFAGDGLLSGGDKRGREEDGDGGPDGKRARFEVIE